MDNKEVTLEENLRVLRMIAELPMDWNAHGASSFSKEHIAIVESVIRDLPVQPMIFPTAADGIQLEYEETCKDRTHYMQFTIYADGECMYFREIYNGSYLQFPIYLAQIKDKVNAFYLEGLNSDGE